MDKARAKELVEQIDSEHPGKRNVEIQVNKEVIGDNTYYIARIVKISLPDKVMPRRD